MRRTLTLLSALLAAACGGDPSGPARAADSLVITGGNFQSGVVAETLANPLQVVATVAGVPVAGQLVCFVAVTEGAGEPFIPCVETDAEGEGETPWTLGSVAGEHLAQARAVVDGEPVAVADYVLEAVPGPVVYRLTMGSFGVGSGNHADVPVALLPDSIFEDEYRNNIEAVMTANGFLRDTVVTAQGRDRLAIKLTGPVEVGDTTTVTFLPASDPDFAQGDMVAEVEAYWPDTGHFIVQFLSAAFYGTDAH